MLNTIHIDAQPVSFTPGQSIMQAARAAGIYIPHLCYHPGFSPYGSCRLCLVKIDGRLQSACTTLAAAGQQIENNSESINANRRMITQMLFVEGNHLCPGCEKSGACQLQAVAYFLGILEPGFTHLYPTRAVDASHPAVMLDFNRCILCELCVRASHQEGKHLFAIGGRGGQAHLIINSASGTLGDTAISATDHAVQVCPVGALMPKHQGYHHPIGQRFYDQHPINQVGDANTITTGEIA